MSKRLIFAISFLSLTLSGCGILSVGYNHADAYLRYSINSYTSFNDAQKEAIKIEVNVFMAWHRKNMLPEYAEFLQELQTVAETGAVLKKEDVARFRAEVRALYVKTLYAAIRPSATLLSELNAPQILELSRSFAKENRKKRESDLSGSHEEQLRIRAEKTVDFFESLVGSFNDTQLEKIRGMSRSLPFVTPIYQSQRETHQARLIEMLENRNSREQIADFLSSWLRSPEADRSHDEQSMMLAFEAGSDDLIANSYQMLNQRQKTVLLKNIVKYIDIFQGLASVN